MSESQAHFMGVAVGVVLLVLIFEVLGGLV